MLGTTVEEIRLRLAQDATPDELVTARIHSEA
jgi:hypothetical protein